MNLLAAVMSLLPGIPADLPFTQWFSSRGVKVEIARLPDGPPWIRGVAELPVTADRVLTVLVDFRHYEEIFRPALKSARVLAIGKDSARLHMVWPYPFPYRNRDAVVAYRGEKREGEAFLLSWKDDPQTGDPKEGIRIGRVAGETRVEPLGPERCRVTYTYVGDLGGKFPAWAQEKAWREEPVQYFRALRRALKLPDSSESHPSGPGLDAGFATV